MKIKNIHCEKCKAFGTIRWEREKVKGWMGLFFKYWKGKIYYSDGAVEGVTLHTRTRRFLD